MSIAEIHGKLSPETVNDRMEDLLTSDVFGTMYYAGWEKGFRDWLLEAQPVRTSGNTLGQFIGSSPVEEVLFSFWPTLPNDKEPDVALLLKSKDGTCRVLLVEAKYLSGPSNAYVIQDESSDSPRTGNQLADQMDGFSKANHDPLIASWFPGTCQTGQLPFAHILVTSHRRLPAEVYKESLESLHRAGMAEFPCPAFWLSWRSLTPHLERYSPLIHDPAGRLILDLITLLEQKELRTFAGFHDLPWPAPVTSGSFWRFSFGHCMRSWVELNLTEGGDTLFWKERL